MVLTTPMVLTKTHGIESVILNHTRMRGPSVTRMWDFLFLRWPEGWVILYLQKNIFFFAQSTNVYAPNATVFAQNTTAFAHKGLILSHKKKQFKMVPNRSKGPKWS